MQRKPRDALSVSNPDFIPTRLHNPNVFELKCFWFELLADTMRDGRNPGSEIAEKLLCVTLSPMPGADLASHQSTVIALVDYEEWY